MYVCYNDIYGLMNNYSKYYFFCSNCSIQPCCPVLSRSRSVELDHLIFPGSRYERVDAIVSGWGATLQGGSKSSKLMEVGVRKSASFLIFGSLDLVTELAHIYSRIAKYPNIIICPYLL